MSAGTLVVESQQDFDKWIAEKSASGAASPGDLQ
jgi:heme/copper-type cytochrome/quinol oxidase subunit 2